MQQLEASPKLPTISVIIAHTRPSINECLASLAKQSYQHQLLEAIVIGEASEQVQPALYDFPVRYIYCPTKNPSFRRNRAMRESTADIFAFIDDDAQASGDWCAQAVQKFLANPQLSLQGGPTLLPPGLGVSHQLTYKIAHAGFFGNGHENLSYASGRWREIAGYITSCNLFIYPARLKNTIGFINELGHGGEDTLLLYEISRNNSCDMLYNPDLPVYHSRGRYNCSYLWTRFKYRLNNGVMIWARPGIYLSNPKFSAGLALGSLLVVLFLFHPILIIPAAAFHLALSFAYALRYWADDWRLTVLFPGALLLQHAVYYLGILAGLISILHPRQYKKIQLIRTRLRCAFS